MLSYGRGHLLDAPHLTIFPGLAIAVLVLGFNFLGDGLRDGSIPMTRRAAQLSALGAESPLQAEAAISFVRVDGQRLRDGRARRGDVADASLRICQQSERRRIAGCR